VSSADLSDVALMQWLAIASGFNVSTATTHGPALPLHIDDTCKTVIYWPLLCTSQWKILRIS